MPIPPSFAAHLAKLAQVARDQAAADGLPGLVPRPWQMPPTVPGTVDLQDPEFFKTACNRDSLNAAIATEYLDGGGGNAGRLGRVMALKLAIDHVACYERALTARHAAPARCRAWAAARRAGHADLTYGVYGVTGRYVNDLDAAAGAVANTPTG